MDNVGDSSDTHTKKFLLVGTSRESISMSLFQDACVKLHMQFEFLPYAHGAAPDVHGDIIYFRDPFNMGSNATDKQFVESLLANNPSATYIDGIRKYEDLFFEDKLVQYEHFSELMPTTNILTKLDYGVGKHDDKRYIIKERLNAGGKGIFFGSGFEFRDNTYLIQEKLDIEYDYRVICLGNEVLPKALKRTVKHDNDSVSKTVGLHVLTEEDIEFAKTVIAKSPNYDLMGLDVAVSRGKHYLIEANRSPQVKIFQTRTGIDVTRMLIQRKIREAS